MAVRPSDPGLWRAVAGDAALLDAAAAADPTRPADLGRLRERASAEAVGVALQLVEARRKAATKFGGLAGRMIADVEGVEQATSLTGSANKAARFASALARRASAGPVLDLGCGVGGDAMALRTAGCDVVVIDRDPVRAAMAQHNAGLVSALPMPPGSNRSTVSAVATDVSTFGVQGCLIHLDPARRARQTNESRSRRTSSFDDLEPGPTVLRQLVQASAGAAVKLSPGVDRDQVVETFGPGELCFTSEPDGTGRRRRLTQATWYAGALEGETSRSAVLVFEGEDALQVSGDPVSAEALPVAEGLKQSGFLVVPDPAVERAELLHRFDLPTVFPGLGLLAAESTPSPSDARHRLLRRGAAWFDILAEMPMRERRVKAWLADHGAGVVEVKTRGRAAEPDVLQRRLRGTGETRFTVFVLRLGTQVRAVITRAVPFNDDA